MKDGAEIQQITENLDDDFDVLRSKRQIVDDESLLTDGKDYTTESSYFTSNESQTTTEQEYSAISSDISLSSVIFLNCTSPQNGVCIEAKFLVQSFKPVPNSINIKIDFKFNVSELGNF